MRPTDDPVRQDGQEPRTTARALRALDARGLRAVFLDLLGRPPYEAEYGPWLGKGRDKLLEHLLGCPEFWEQWWEEQLYYFLLIDNFRPTTSTSTAVPGKLAEGRLDVREALHRLALTPTFDLRNPGADTFVTVVMEQYCGLVVQDNQRELEIGKGAYDGGKGRFLGRTAESQADVITNCVEHKLAAQHLLQRESRRLLREDLDPARLKQEAARFHRDPTLFLEIVRGWLLDEPYDRRLERLVPKSNRLFVRGLFVDLLDRLPTQEELEPMRNALDGLADPRPLRAVLCRLVLDSRQVDLPRKDTIQDPTAWIAERFRRLLGREAGPEELKTFVTVFHEEECDPGMILYALLSHSEYQSY